MLEVDNYFEDDQFCARFWFSPTFNGYKMVKSCVSGIDHVANQVEMHLLSTGSRRQVELGNLDGLAIYSHGFNTNGAIFWIGLKLGVEEDEDDIDLIVSFDIVMEVFTLIPMPPSPFLVRATCQISY
ncbi:hypothetical protein K1719_041296 [Acacia pycnantha]|nr:hypothetical protein K1719_041296 [Acacia pycnantha]